MKFDDDLDMKALGVAVGNRIRAFREQHGLSQRDIAERTGIHREQIVRYEGGTLPAPKFLIILARFMDITVDELLFGPSDGAVVLTDRLLRKRVSAIERMEPEARRWLLDLMDAFIANEGVGEEDLAQARPSRTPR